MENIKAAKHLDKTTKTSFKNYFLAILKEGAYIERCVMIINGSEVVAYTLKKDLPPTSIIVNRIYGQLNFEAVKAFLKKGYKMREAKLKRSCSGDTRSYFFSDYKQPMFNY